MIAVSKKEVGKEKERAFQIATQGQVPPVLKKKTKTFVPFPKNYKSNCALLIAQTKENYNTQKADTIQTS